MHPSHQLAYEKAEALYRSAHKVHEPRPVGVIDVRRFIDKPELWAEHQIRYKGWGWHATERVVRRARILRAQLNQGV